MRGEDWRRVGHIPSNRGSPPHARGRQDSVAPRRTRRRITPACAGKTPLGRYILRRSQDHPRMRGEDRSRRRSPRSGVGSPPHARGRRCSGTRTKGMTRITPACAGKTDGGDQDRGPEADHPRMRGEDQIINACLDIKGITPACAGKTRARTRTAMSDWDHPRMRGEDRFVRVVKSCSAGSPPHARGRPLYNTGSISNNGITPACAGKTSSSPAPGGTSPDHPRMRGEDAKSQIWENPLRGSPPHARGRR